MSSSTCAMTKPAHRTTPIAGSTATIAINMAAGSMACHAKQLQRAIRAINAPTAIAAATASTGFVPVDDNHLGRLKACAGRVVEAGLP